jgi:predicted GNAT superfamily acetyltransferase
MPLYAHSWNDRNRLSMSVCTGETMAIVYRRIETIDEYRAVEDLQAQVWGSDARDVVPLHLLLTANKNGGLALGAFDADLTPPDDLIGFVFGFVGLTAAGQIKHCSHMLGVLPHYRDRRIGEELKRRQRDFVLAQGITLMTWTFDPLQSRNARLNLRKLGAICRTYARNLYGAMSDQLNAGVPSDRFEVEWHLASRHVAVRLAHAEPEPNLAALLAAGGVVLNPAPSNAADDAPAPVCHDPSGARVLIRFPTDIQALKMTRPAEVLTWRMQVRDLCERSFAAGYTITDVFTAGACSYYLLHQHWSIV